MGGWRGGGGGGGGGWEGVGTTKRPPKLSIKVYVAVYNEKALKCKPSALIFGRGRAKELLHVRDDLRKRTR